jgi:hypothetical protein
MKKINKPTDDAVVISCQLIDQIRKQGGKNWADLLSLYVFYYRCGKHQKTNQPWVTNSFASQGLRWGADKVRTRKSRLISLGLLENKKLKQKNGKFGKSVVKVFYMWGQSQIEEAPEENTTTGVVSQQVVKGQQMLKVDKNKCLNLNQKEERRKRDSTIPQNHNNTDVEIPQSSCHVDTIAESSNVGKSSCVSEISSSTSGNKAGVLSRDQYVAVMSKRFSDLCGIDGVHILNADLAANARRINWSKQIDYWDKRLAGIDEHQAEAWRLIATYFRVFYSSNKHYPDTRFFFRGWRAIGWKEEKDKILAYCNTHNGVPVITNYVEARAEVDPVVKAKWLLSSADYSRWFVKDNMGNDGGDYSADSFENRPSGGPQTMSQWDEMSGKKIEEESENERIKKIELDLIGRARAMISLHNDNIVFKGEITQVLIDYKDANITLNAFRRAIEALESSQPRREVKP